MIKLYRRENGRVTAYHEAWMDGPKITEHWGPIGGRGEIREHSRDDNLSEDQNIQQALAQPLADAFEPIDIDEHAVLIIEYTVDGMGTPEDLDKRHKLEDRMNETLGWTGLGECDGGSIGTGTMEVCCFVVDFDTAKRVIEGVLRETDYSDYLRIYNENED